MEERRQSNRIPLHLQLGLLQKETNQAFQILRGNINEGGIGGYSRDTVEAGDEVSIRITFPQREGKDASEMITGKTIWAHRDGNFIAFGIAFSQFDSSTHPHLNTYLQYAAQFE
ncbi:MAG: PilZ domain-containing protein [Nitrospiria bacterium]